MDPPEFTYRCAMLFCNKFAPWAWMVIVVSGKRWKRGREAHSSTSNFSSCERVDCNSWDFLPIKCDYCCGVFCYEHTSYANHHCAKSDSKDVQVPICPLCDVSIPFKMQDSLDIALTVHIDQECESDFAIARRKWIVHHISSCAW